MHRREKITRNRGFRSLSRTSSFRNTKTRAAAPSRENWSFLTRFRMRSKRSRAHFRSRCLFPCARCRENLRGGAQQQLRIVRFPMEAEVFYFNFYFSIFLRRASVASSSFCSSDFSAFKVETFLYLFAKVSSSRSGIVPISHIVLNWPPTACCNF